MHFCCLLSRRGGEGGSSPRSSRSSRSSRPRGRRRRRRRRVPWSGRDDAPLLLRLMVWTPATAPTRRRQTANFSAHRVKMDKMAILHFRADSKLSAHVSIFTVGAVLKKLLILCAGAPGNVERRVLNSDVWLTDGTRQRVTN